MDTNQKIIKKIEEAIKVEERGSSYGDAIQNHQDIADLWSILLRQKLLKPISALEVALLMDLMKTARLMKSPDHLDSLEDKVNYCGIAMVISDHDQECKDQRSKLMNAWSEDNGEA